MTWMETNGVSLRYELEGHGSQTVVLVHELGGTLESWDETLPAFTQNFRTLRYDQRGCGYSEKKRAPITLDEMVGDIVGLLDGLGISAPCHLAGTAFGTGIAMAFAARHPARVARMAIASPVPGSTAGRGTYQSQRADLVEREGMRASVTSSLDISYPEILRGNRERFATYRSRWLANDPYCFAAMNRMLGGMDLSGELVNIRCPTLVLGAIHDIHRPPAFAKAVAQQIGGARYVEVDSGHFMAVQTPDLFARHVVPFLLDRQTD